MKALFCTAVWGEAYIDRFLKYSLPTQLSGGNLGAFDRDSLFLVITDNPARITSSPAYRTLSSLVSVECHDGSRILDSKRKSKYSKLTQCQNYALERADKFDAVFFGYADALWADGSYRTARRYIEQGYDAVFSMGYPVSDAPARSIIDAMNAPPAEAIAIPPREFARLVYNNFHSMAKANHWRNPWMSNISSYAIWDVPGQGTLTRSFHLHPVAVRVNLDRPEFFYPFRSTLDDEYVARMFNSNPRVKVCTDSDEMGVCSLATHPEGTYRLLPARPPNLGDLAFYAERNTGLLHRQLFGQSIRLKIADAEESSWADAESEAAALNQQINWRLSLPDSVLELECPSIYRARKFRQKQHRHWYTLEESAAVWIAFQDFSQTLALRHQARLNWALLRVLNRLGLVDAAAFVIRYTLGEQALERMRARARAQMDEMNSDLRPHSRLSATGFMRYIWKRMLINVRR